MYSKFLKICSFVLTIAILISLLPVQALGAEVEDVEPVSSDIIAPSDAIETFTDVTESIIQSNAQIVSEIVDGRTEYSKEYLMSNGLNLLVIYPEAVHYKKDNVWEEIDNTLKAVGVGSTARYTNTAGEWTVSFPQQINSNQCVSISRDGYTLSFELAGELSAKKNEHATLKSAASNNVTVDKEAELNLQSANSATAIIEERDLTTLRESMEYPETFVSSVFSRMKYNNVYNNTDIVYDLNANSVKESIVINTFNPDLYGYRYTLSTGGMVPVLQDGGSILLYNADRTEVIMTMPAPFMIDDAGEMTSDVRVSLVTNGTEYLLTYYVPVAWLADENRAWPVILDPVVEAGTSVHNILDHFVAEYYSESNSSGALMCGYNPDFGKMRTFIKFSEIPNLPAANIIVNATLSLTYLGGSSGTTRIGVHKINTNWETGTITWANQPAHNPIVEDYNGVTGSRRYSWHVTDIARSWYETGNTGIMLKALESIENGTTENWKKFYSVDYSTSNTERWPSLTITYRNSSGIESYWDYTTVSSGRAGTGYINNLTGNLTWVHDDLGFDGNRMPVAISHVYNVDDCADNLFGLGYGWRTNYHQTVQLSESGGYYIWTDGDGTKHELVPGTETNTYVDQEGLCLTLTISTNNTTSPYTITDKYGNSSVFDSLGRLVNLINNQETTSQIEITYTASSKRIDTIKDGVGRIYKFTYNSSNLLTKIGYHGANDANGVIGAEITNVQFAYSSSKLIKITYDYDDPTEVMDSHFTYSDRLLTSATDVDGCKATFSYSPGAAKRVIKTQEYDGTVAGNWMTFEYARNKVKISSIAPDSNSTSTSTVARTQIRYFNDFGNLISCQDDEGSAEFYQYAANRHISDLSDVNKLTLSSKKQNTVVNLMEHSSFERGNYWVANGSNRTCEVTDTKSHLGSKSLKVTAATSGICAYINADSNTSPDSFSVPSGKTLTFSAYVLSQNAYVQLGLGQGFTIQSASEVQKLESDEEWKRIEVSYTNSTNSTVSVAPLLIVCEVSGQYTIYMDCVQIELSAGASRYNLIENGDFRTTSFWSSSAGRTTEESAWSNLDNTAYKMTGDPGSARNIFQSIYVSGKAGDVFVLAGWGKGDPAPVAGSTREFGLKIRFYHADGSSNYCNVDFDATSCNSDDWQYTAGRVTATEDYTSIVVYLTYYYGVNTVYFDGIQLYKEEFGERYTYDSNRNVTSVTDILGQTTTYTYTNNDPVKITEPSGLVTTNTYSNHNLTRSVQSYTHEGNPVILASYSYQYDTYGNQLWAYSEVDGVVKQTYTSYSSNHNYIATTTDELGNVTTYEYDPKTGMLLSVQYPEDDGVTKTTYTYDSLYRLKTTQKVTGQGTTMLVQNYYDGNNLSDLTTQSTRYNFEYGTFNLLKEVAVGRELNTTTGGISLAKYTYTDDIYRNIKTVDYGNQDSVQYTYDDFGRIIQETYYNNGSTTASRTVSYVYNNTGTVAATVDSESEITTKYYYDTVGRNTDVHEIGDSTTRHIKYTYDEFGRLQISEEAYGTTSYSTKYFYYGNNQIWKIEAGNSTEQYIYDEYGRLDEWYTYHNNSSNHLIRKNIHYAQPDERTTSSRPSVWAYTSTGGYSLIYNYDYDENGNIVTETVDGKTTTYAYDSADQLIREDNQKAGKTWVWTYDDAGNIKSKKEYGYTTAEIPSGTPLTIGYAYNNATWGDLLTSYNGNTIWYDGVGNPTNDGTWYYTWVQGRQLDSMERVSDGALWFFTYNADGMRTKRTNTSTSGSSTTTYTYTYHGSQLTHMKYGSIELHFSYDALGSPMAVVYGGNTYYYLLNLQGDVVGILDSSGTRVVTYTYDAWGRPLTTTGSMASTLGQYNPLRYRGYVYDRETGLYYLQSRYYNPTWGRFLNADSLLSNGNLQGLNLFAYCNNNPVNFLDKTGTFPWAALIIVGTLALGITYGATTDRNLAEELSGDDDYDNQYTTRLTLPPAPLPGKSTHQKPQLAEDTLAPSRIEQTTPSAPKGLTTQDRINNIIIAGGGGLMIGGALVFMGGAAACIAGYSGTTVAFLGMTGKQAVAWGILAYDVFPIFIAPFLGLEIEPLEYPS